MNNMDANDFSVVKNFLDNNKFVKSIVLPNELIPKLEEQAFILAKIKIKEPHHKFDNNKEFKRQFTGLKGEAAVEMLTGISVIDWKIGNSNQFNHPDLKKLKIGVKTSDYGNYPVIFIKNYYPQIICIVDEFDKNKVYVCGLALVDVLNKYQSLDLIKDDNLRKRHKKSGFYGFENLVSFDSIDDLKNIINDNICPECEKYLIVRKGQYGEFIGCSGFPKCRFTKPIWRKK